MERLYRVLRRPRPIDPTSREPAVVPPAPPAPSPAAPPTGMILPAVPLPITARTPFRATGDVTIEVWRQAFAELASPVGDVDACYDAAKGMTALALTQAIRESSLGRAGNANANLNALGLMIPDSRPGQRMRFATWADGFREWKRRMTDPSYKGGVYMQGGLEMSLEAFIVTYVGGPMCWTTQGQTCANGERWVPGDRSQNNSINVYLDQTLIRLNRYRTMHLPGQPPVGPDPYPEQAAPDFGRVRQPPFTDRLIPDSQTHAWDNLGQRDVYGVVYHRMVGTLWGTDSWFRTAQNGLTDWGVDHVTGEILRWNDPWGKGYPANGVSANRSGWASGPWQNAPGDGQAFVAKYGANGVNRLLSAIEVSGNYGDPLSAKAIDMIAWLSAWLADQERIPWTGYPVNPATGLVFTYHHGEFQTNKPCAGPVLIGLIPRIIERTREIMKAAQQSQ